MSHKGVDFVLEVLESLHGFCKGYSIAKLYKLFQKSWYIIRNRDIIYNSSSMEAFINFIVGMLFRKGLCTL